MSWTRSPVRRAGIAGAAGAALILSVLPPTGYSPPSPVTGSAQDTVIAMAAGEFSLPSGPTEADLAAARAERERMRAARDRQRTELAEREKKADKRRAAARASRSEQREAAPRANAAAPAPVVGTRYATVALNVRTAPGGPVLDTLSPGAAVSITDRTDAGWRQVRHDGRVAWVSGQYLSANKPAPQRPAAPTGPSSAPCARGSSIESGLVPNAVAVYRAVCARYPEITSYGGYRPDGGHHGSGRAVDVMVSGALGWDIANWVRANAGALGVSEVIYAQQIWTVQRSSEGWRGMSDRGSATSNHYDHVHISTY